MSKLMTTSKEKGVTPVMTVDGADGTETESSLQMTREIGKSQDKEQVMYILWGTGKGNYTPLLHDPHNDFLKGHNNYPASVSEAYILLLH